MKSKKRKTKDNHITRYKNTNEFLRASELVPDCDEDEILEGNLLIMKNYMNPDFIFDNSNIRKGIRGIYPFVLILSMNSKQERIILFLIYERKYSIKEIADSFNYPYYKIRTISKYAHNHFYENLKALGRLQIAMKRYNENSKRDGGV